MIFDPDNRNLHVQDFFMRLYKTLYIHLDIFVDTRDESCGNGNGPTGRRTGYPFGLRGAWYRKNERRGSLKKPIRQLRIFIIVEIGVVRLRLLNQGEGKINT